jgi:amino acid transporter/nucleotide-binding universal stress UspA family protein
MSDPANTTPPGSRSSSTLRTAQVIIISGVMFTFISYWKTAAVVLCDLASTAYYIGGIVEQAIGPAAPWFILAVMIFSYFVRMVYLESCSLFVRGGAYRVVKEAMGGFFAKLSVSALMFDFVLTGPISGVSAGQYLFGLIYDGYRSIAGLGLDAAPDPLLKNWFSALFAIVVTIYFFRLNVIGIHESSDKAVKIMIATTVMAAIVFLWCGITMVVRLNDPAQPRIQLPTVQPKFQNPNDPLSAFAASAVGMAGSPLGQAPLLGATSVPPGTLPPAGGADPLGFIAWLTPGFAQQIRDLHGTAWLSLIGIFGIFAAFGHSILAMSGEETLAQVYREVEAPKMRNFQKAAFIVFIYSFILTGGISFLAVMLIPEADRNGIYHDNLISGLAMRMVGPEWAKLLLSAFVVVIGGLILSGGVNTAIIGSNGVINRVAEDGVMPDWFLRPHPRFGTTYRVLWLVIGLQILTIVLSGGDVNLLGEAYAFGVIWSFVFTALAMVVLRFREPGPREFKVPLNVRVGKYEVPIGLSLIFLILLLSALVNLSTKIVATVSGVIFTASFLGVFIASEYFNKRRLRGVKHEHTEQFNQQITPAVSIASLGLTKPYRKLVAIRSPQNLFMLEKALSETDPDTTAVVVMTAKFTPPGATVGGGPDFDTYDQKLMTAVVDRAEKAGKEVKPMIVPTNNPLFAVLTTAKEIGAQELIMGASNKFTADEQLDQIGLYWINMHGGQTPPLTIRLLSRDRDVFLDLAGGNRIPKITERKARSVAELRAAGVGVNRVMLVHAGTPGCSDLFQAVLTMLDPKVALTVAAVKSPDMETTNGSKVIQHDRDRAKQLGREVTVVSIEKSEPGVEIVQRAREAHQDVIIVALPSEPPIHQAPSWNALTHYILKHAHCPVFLAAQPGIPQDVVD